MLMRNITGPDGAVQDGVYVDNVGKSFRGRPVVKSVSLRLRRGEIAGLLGPNGAGKTTCFYMITGLIPADYGAIYLDGEHHRSRCTSRKHRHRYMPRRRRSSAISVGENLEVVELLRRTRRAGRR